MTKRRLSLCWEIDEIENATEAARILCDGLWQSQHATEADALIAPRAASAVMTLVGQRLRLVRQAVQELVPPDLLAGPHNIVEMNTVSEDEVDILLPLGRPGPPNP